MLGFYLQLIAVASLAFIVYLLSRSLPRLSDEGEDASMGTFDKFINKLPLERLDSVFHRFFEKFLHKVKIIVLKIDNVINHYLTTLKKQNSTAKEQQEEIKERMNHLAGNGEKNGE